jgi:hypothetical protein
LSEPQAPFIFLSKIGKVEALRKAGFHISDTFVQRILTEADELRWVADNE